MVALAHHSSDANIYRQKLERQIVHMNLQLEKNLERKIELIAELARSLYT